MENYRVISKRDGQEWKFSHYIYARNFNEAKKEFAQDMTKGNWELSNNIVWLSEEMDNVEVAGWYDLNCSELVCDDEGNTIYAESELELFCSEKDINDGFTYWNEDVYQWKLQNLFLIKFENEEDEVFADDEDDARSLAVELFLIEEKEDYSNIEVTEI